MLQTEQDYNQEMTNGTTISVASTSPINQQGIISDKDWNLHASNVSMLSELKKKQKELQLNIEAFSSTVPYLEYENYNEYYVLKTFKRGKSISGIVDLEQLKNNQYGDYYEKITYDHLKVNDKNESKISSHESSLNVSPIIESNEPKNTDTITPSSIDNKANEPPDSIMTRIRTRTRGNKSNDRQMVKPELKAKIQNSSNTIKNTATSKPINSLYEVIVPKDKFPERRSDWILPQRKRYVMKATRNSTPKVPYITISRLFKVPKIERLINSKQQSKKIKRSKR
ncbi:hypothetical protein TBLA_0D01090 [Henningerozyma blattae CBS 6284]|uniref:Uncharacterized protein n=1 Tax=Henningerozyma blattae (strain ATCC 34711 / CBS 6284 / DSM 70876 / NBRC 10599 / NRRL Y-10934 / UCD 77-7) TaxID=1071380 RepID=I2H2L5_HENB6|nr:hypothetical protein TBLA_0D01090 [Tetrapisispora blattae CBS 6284]CCH60617.1 hypothetical protein TBLA_0D01090 [Tetrapisispora blattae CBS 6284]